MELTRTKHKRGETWKLQSEQVYEVVKFEDGTEATIRTVVHTSAGELQVLDIDESGKITLGGEGFKPKTIPASVVDKAVREKGWFVA